VQPGQVRKHSKQLPLIALDRTGPDDEFARLSRPIVLLGEGATEPPTELCLLAAGVIETTKGMFKCTAASCESVMSAHAELGRDYPFDYEHASLMAMFANDPAESGKAAGWFKPMARDGAIWATGIAWTPKAREKILAREFRYISPTFRASEEGEVQELHSCALTNDPATKKAKPIINARAAGNTSPSGDQESYMLKLLAARLGLSDTATEADVFAALSRMQDDGKALIALTGKATAAEALGVITGWKTSAGEAEALRAKVAEQEKTALSAKIDALIDGAKKDGRLPPASEKAARDVALAGGLVSLEAMLSVLPKHGKAAVEKVGVQSDGTIALTAEDLEGCRKTGLDPKKYAEFKAASLARRTAAA